MRCNFGASGHQTWFGGRRHSSVCALHGSKRFADLLPAGHVDRTATLAVALLMQFTSPTTTIFQRLDLPDQVDSTKNKDEVAKVWELETNLLEWTSDSSRHWIVALCE